MNLGRKGVEEWEGHAAEIWIAVLYRGEYEWIDISLIITPILEALARH